MKFSVSTPDLQKHLGSISGVIPTKSTLPILENFLFEVSGNELDITATDLEMYTTIRVNVEGKDKGKFVIPAKRLLETVRSLTDPTVKFDVDTDTFKIVMKTENGEYKLTGESSESYPSLPDFKGEKELKISSEILKRLISKAEFAVSSDELRPAMTGVLFQIRPEEICAVATDGHRLVRMRNTSFKSKHKATDVIVPAKALKLIVKSLEGVEGTIFFNESHIKFSIGNMILITRLIEEKYPNYESVIPIDNDKKLTVNKNQLLSSVRRTSLFANTTTRQVRFSITGSSMAVSAEDIDFGSEAKETLTCDYNAEDMEIGFNAVYVVDVLSHIDTDEAVFMLNTPTRAVTVRPPTQQEGEDILMLVMPVRLNA
ncbi:MAG: DNA polymerase III subunit beta [Ignavibacteriales bacterium]|nr:DNA polymerase III subunit beta [Ignavibacteriales bacterium]